MQFVTFLLYGAHFDHKHHPETRRGRCNRTKIGHSSWNPFIFHLNLSWVSVV